VKNDLATEKWRKSKHQVPAEVSADALPDAPKKSRGALLEEHLLALMIKYAKTIELVQNECEQFFSEEGRAIITSLQASSEPGLDISPKTRDYYNYLCLRADVETITEKDAVGEVKFLIKRR